MSAEQQKNRFLLHFEADHRGAIGNGFYEIIRTGEHMPGRICSLVFCQIRDAGLHEKTEVGDSVPWREVLYWMQTDPEAAQDFALLCYQREMQSPEDREKRKAENAKFGREQHMAKLPATEKQIETLRRLGYDGEIQNRAHASALIEEKKNW